MNLPSLPKTKRTFNQPDVWGYPIKYSAFTAGQQSLLLQVADKGTPVQEKIDTMASLFDSCVDAGVPFTSLPTCVVEKVFVLMRTISVGEIMKLKYVCQHKSSEDKLCGQEIIVPVNLDDVNITIPEGYKEDFELCEGYWLRMKKPTYASALSLNNKEDDIPRLFATFADCLYTEEESWKIEDPNESGLSHDVIDQRRKKFETFVSWVSDNLDTTMITDINKSFFSKLPHLHYYSLMKCPKCNTEHPIEFNGLDEIFI